MKPSSGICGAIVYYDIAVELAAAIGRDDFVVATKNGQVDLFDQSFALTFLSSSIHFISAGWLAQCQKSINFMHKEELREGLVSPVLSVTISSKYFALIAQLENAAPKFERLGLHGDLDCALTTLQAKVVEFLFEGKWRGFEISREDDLSTCLHAIADTEIVCNGTFFNRPARRGLLRAQLLEIGRVRQVQKAHPEMVDMLESFCDSYRRRSMVTCAVQDRGVVPEWLSLGESFSDDEIERYAKHVEKDAKQLRKTKARRLLKVQRQLAQKTSAREKGFGK